MNPEQNQNLNTESNLQTLEKEMVLTAQEISDFKKLPKEEQEKEKQERLFRLENLKNEADQAMSEALKTGDLERVKKIKGQLDKEISDLQIKFDIADSLEVVSEIFPDLEAKSTDVALSKLNDEGYVIHKLVEKKLQEEIDWGEKMKDSYKIVSVTVHDLFYDNDEHTYDDILVRAKGNKLEPISARLALSVCEQLPENSNKKIVAMNNIVSQGVPGVFLFLVTTFEDNRWGALDFTDGSKKFGSDMTFIFSQQ